MLLHRLHGLSLGVRGGVLGKSYVQVSSMAVMCLVMIESFQGAATFLLVGADHPSSASISAFNFFSPPTSVARCFTFKIVLITSPVFVVVPMVAVTFATI